MFFIVVFHWYECSNFYLLLLYVDYFSYSLSLKYLLLFFQGLSLTIQSLEITQPQQLEVSSSQDNNMRQQHMSNLKLHILINLFILLGQLVGSSGGQYSLRNSL